MKKTGMKKTGTSQTGMTKMGTTKMGMTEVGTTTLLTKAKSTKLGTSKTKTTQDNTQKTKPPMETNSRLSKNNVRRIARVINDSSTDNSHDDTEGEQTSNSEYETIGQAHHAAGKPQSGDEYTDSREDR